MPLPGQPKDTPLPSHLRRWNWGAFFLNVFWGLGNRSYIALLMLVPVVNIVMLFVLGAKGNAWAWQNRLWQDEAHFKRVQRNWAVAGLALWLVVSWAGYMYFTANRDNEVFQGGVAQMRANPEVIALMGQPIEDGRMVQAQVVVSPSGKGNAQYVVRVSGPECSGQLFIRADKPRGAWQIYLLVLQPDCRDEPIVLVNDADFAIPNAASPGD